MHNRWLVGLHYLDLRRHIKSKLFVVAEYNVGPIGVVKSDGRVSSLCAGLPTLSANE